MIPPGRTTATKKPGRPALRVACAFLLVAGASAQDAFEVEEGAADRGSSYLNLAMSDDLLTLKARNAAIREVVDEIARQSDLTVVSNHPLHGRLTLEIEGLPLFEALRRIMRGQSYLLYQAEAASGSTVTNPARRGTLWVFAAESRDQETAGPASPDIAQAIAALQLQLMSDDLRVRQQAIKDLRRLKVTEAIVPLSYALTDEDKKSRVYAVYALADVGGDDAVAALAAALADENAWVRAETAYALGTLGGDAAVQALKHALHDAASDVRESAIEAFSDIGGRQSAAALAVALQDPDASLRVEAVEALMDIGGETALRMLEKALEDRDGNVQIAAREAMAELLRQDE